MTQHWLFCIAVVIHSSSFQQSPLTKMASTPIPTDLIRILATYGTLRDDDDSGAPWTKAFIADRTHAYGGYVDGYRLYYSPLRGYPLAVPITKQHVDVNEGINPHSRLRVRILVWKEERWHQKLLEADEIEGYQIDNEAESEYVRRVVRIYLDNPEEYFKDHCVNHANKPPLFVDAWMYICEDTQRFKDAIPLEHGDWLLRPR